MYRIHDYKCIVAALCVEACCRSHWCRHDWCSGMVNRKNSCSWRYLFCEFYFLFSLLLSFFHSSFPTFFFHFYPRDDYLHIFFFCCSFALPSRSRVRFYRFHGIFTFFFHHYSRLLPHAKWKGKKIRLKCKMHSVFCFVSVGPALFHHRDIHLRWKECVEKIRYASIKRAAPRWSPNLKFWRVIYGSCCCFMFSRIPFSYKELNFNEI